MIHLQTVQPVLDIPAQSTLGLVQGTLTESQLGSDLYQSLYPNTQS